MLKLIQNKNWSVDWIAERYVPLTYWAV